MFQGDFTVAEAPGTRAIERLLERMILPSSSRFSNGEIREVSAVSHSVWP